MRDRFAARWALATVLFALAPISFGRGMDRPADPRPRVPEAIEILALIVARGADMGPGDGWFHPSESRYSWHWLSSRLDSDDDGSITPAELEGMGKPFLSRLDRDRSGAITADDLDWSENSEYLKRRLPARKLSSRLDTDSNGRITLEEWAALHKELSGDKGFMTPGDLADWVMPAPEGPPTGEMPSRLTLLKGLFSGELGSFQEGPALDSLAPDFTLATHDRQQTISLGQFKGQKPVVLIFGSFT